MIRRLASILLLAVALSTLVAAVPATASAAIVPTPVGGARWPVTTIRVFDGTPFRYREGVNIAMRAWNDSRIGLTLVRTTNRRAAHIVIGTKLFPGSVAGTGTLGYARPAVILLDTSLVATEPIVRNGIIQDFPGGAIPEAIADVAAHEFGHVLGLRHTTGCSLMVGSGEAACGYRPPSGQWVCRLVQRRDLLAMVRRYRGTGVLRRGAYCPLSATAAGRVGTITVGASNRTRAISLDWRNTTNTYGYVVARSAAGGSCPTSPDGGAQRTNTTNSSLQELWSSTSIPMEAATYCYSVWSRNGRGRLTGPTTVSVNVTTPHAEPVSGLSNVVAGSSVTLSWSQPSGTRVIRIYRYATDGTCRVPAFTPVLVVSSGATSATETDVPSGNWTYAVTRSDDPDDDADSDGAPAFASPPLCTSAFIA